MHFFRPFTGASLHYSFAALLGSGGKLPLIDLEFV